MPISSSEIKFYLSGGASNSDPAASIGGAISTTVAGTNLFANVNSSDAASGRTYYRCIYVKNTNSSLTWENAKIWFQSNTPSLTTEAYIALDGNGLNATAEGPKADQYTAPSGETFTAPASSGTALTLGNIPAQQYYAVWVKLVVDAASVATANDGFTIRVVGDTAA